MKDMRSRTDNGVAGRSMATAWAAIRDGGGGRVGSTLIAQASRDD